MEDQKVSEDSLEVVEFKSGNFPTIDAGTYPAEYTGLKVFMDKTQWGMKKCARLYFKILKGNYRDKKASFKGQFWHDEDSGAWLIGSKSKLAEAIAGVTGGQKIDESHKGTRVYIVIKTKDKKNGEPFSFVDSIIPWPVDDEDAPKSEPKQESKPKAEPEKATVRATEEKPAEKKSSGGLLDDLTELSDFND